MDYTGTHSWCQTGARLAPDGARMAPAGAGPMHLVHSGTSLAPVWHQMVPEPDYGANLAPGVAPGANLAPLWHLLHHLRPKPANTAAGLGSGTILAPLWHHSGTSWCQNGARWCQNGTRMMFWCRQGREDEEGRGEAHSDVSLVPEWYQNGDSGARMVPE